MTKIPPPQEVGLPEKYEKWRPNQEEAITNILHPAKRSTVVCAPTGFGKTGVVLAAAKLSGEPTCIVTSTRGLQNQYMSEGEGMGLVSLMGRRNYQCSMQEDPDYTCEQGYNARCPYKGTVMCPSSQAEMRAATSFMVVTNYDKWTATKKYGMGMSHFKRVIFDEGHEAPNALSRAMQVVLHHKEIEETLGVDFLDGSDADDMRAWKKWATQTRVVAEDELKEARSRVCSTTEPKPSWVRHFTHMRNLVRRLITVSTCSAKDWVVEQLEYGFQFDPVRPGRYAESALLLQIPKIAFVSATIRPKTMFMTGVGRDYFTFIEYASDFDPRRCPIYWVPTQNVDSRHPDNSMLWMRLDQVIASRAKQLNRNGIVHTISYSRRDEIVEGSRFADRMLINKQGDPPTEMVELFKEAINTGTILVSPSVGTGYDFPGDECRWQFVCKVPFEPPSKIQKARQADDKEYSHYRAMQYLVQAFGRDMRSRSDWSERFIADNNIEWFRPQYAHLAPKSFHSVFKRVDILPQPLYL